MQTGLTECTIMMLSVINSMYRLKKITFDEFLSYTDMKLTFLSNNIDCISSEDDKIKANEILSECTSIIYEYQSSL